MGKKGGGGRGGGGDEMEEKRGEAGGGGEAKKSKAEKAALIAVLKIDMHCEGCASKIIKCINRFEGVEKTTVDRETNELIVEGKVDPSKLRDELEAKTKKKVQFVLPLAQQDGKQNKVDNHKNDKAVEKKPEEPPVTTAILKLGGVGLHCQGCIGKIKRVIAKDKGVQSVTLDKEKDLVTVKGTMDSTALADKLKKRIRRPVEIVPPKKEKEKEKEKGKDDKHGSSGNEANKKDGGAKNNKKAGGGGGGKAEENNGGGKLEGCRMEYHGPQGFENAGYGYGHGYGYGYGFVYGEPVHAPQLFSDENPHACSVM